MHAYQSFGFADKRLSGISAPCVTCWLLPTKNASARQRLNRDVSRNKESALLLEYSVKASALHI